MGVKPLHPGKTRVGDCVQPGQGFECLGLRFEAGRRYVRDKSLRVFKDKVKARTIRSRGDSLERIVADLYQMLRGWFECLKHARGYAFERLDQMIRLRLRAILREQEKRPSMGQSKEDHRRWPNACFADQGMFIMLTAMNTRDTPRWGNQQLESRVREIRQHGSEGGEETSGPLSGRHGRRIEVNANRSIRPLSPDWVRR